MNIRSSNTESTQSNGLNQELPKYHHNGGPSRSRTRSKHTTSSLLVALMLYQDGQLILMISRHESWSQ